MLARMSFTITVSIFLAGLICFFMLGCENRSEKGIHLQTAVPLSGLAFASPPEEMAVTPSATVEAVEFLPSEIQILQVGYFHGDDVSAKSGETWFGLYPIPNGYELIASRIAVEAVFDPMVDDSEDQKTGKKVSVNLSTEPLFLVKGLDTLKNGAIKTLSSGQIILKPGKCLRFTFDNRDDYHLTVFGEREISAGFQNYEIELSKGQLSQVIIAYDSTDGDVPRLLWAGDLDRDGQLDLLVDATNHYAVSAPTLFLSSMAEDDHLLEKVAQLTTSC